MKYVRSAVRQLTKRPGLSAIIVLTLALGVGANAAIFSLFHEMLIQPLPVPDPDRLVILSAPGAKSGHTSCNNMGDCEHVFSYPMLRDLEREQTVFTGIAAQRAFTASIAAPGMRAATREGVAVNGNYFSVLRLRPKLGRLIDRNDEPKVGEGRVAVLSYNYWQNAFGGDPGVLGRVLTVNGQPMTVVGVAPRRFSGTSVGSRPQIFVPLTMRWLMEPYYAPSDENRRDYWAYLFARLKPGVSIEEAEAAINVPYRAIINDVEAPLQSGASEQYLEKFRERRLELEPGTRGQSALPQYARVPLLLLFGITALVLVIACVNIANLLFARGAMRAGEMSLRAAIGASRRQLVAQLLSEAVLLGLLGCLAGLPAAESTLRLIRFLMPADLAVGLDMGLSGAAVSFAVAMSLVTVLFFGLLPALAASGSSAGAVLKEQAGQASGGRGLARLRRSLATAQIAFSMVLLVLAGLFTQSLANVARTDLGIMPESVATFSVSPELSGYTAERSAELFRQIEANLAALPGAISVGTAAMAVMMGNTWGSNVSVQGFEPAPNGDTEVQRNEVGQGYFRTLGIPLLAGREFSTSDSEGRPKVAIVNETFGEKFGLGHDVLGKRMAVGGGRPELDIEIVGLVGDAKYSDVKEEIPPQMFFPRYQDETLGSMNFYVRTRLAPEDMLDSMVGVVHELDPGLPVDSVATLPDLIRDNTFLDRMIGVLTVGFALLATLLAATGLYGVLAYSVAQRTRELGMRQALGATPRRVRGMVLRQVGWMGLIGGASGLVIALLLGRAAESLLYGLSGFEPTVLAAATVVLGAVVLAAGYLPAHRASSIDPMRALRYE